MAKRDYYEVLELKKGRARMRSRRLIVALRGKYHPDHNPGNKEAEQKFKEVQEAHDILSDAEKRKQYDRFGHAGMNMGGGPGGPFQWGGGAGGPGGPTIDIDFGGLDLDDLLGGLFGGGMRGRGRSAGGARGPRGFAQKGQDVETSVTIDFLTAAKGGPLDVTIPDLNKTITITIPPATSTGSRLRLGGLGGEGVGGGPRGDLLSACKLIPTLTSPPRNSTCILICRSISPRRLAARRLMSQRSTVASASPCQPALRAGRNCGCAEKGSLIEPANEATFTSSPRLSYPKMSARRPRRRSTSSTASSR